MPTFQDPELQQASLSYFCTPLPGRDSHDVERPSKRARLATANGNQTAKDLRSSIVSKIYSLLGLEVNTALTGLSQKASYAIITPISIWNC